MRKKSSLENVGYLSSAELRPHHELSETILEARQVTTSSSGGLSQDCAVREQEGGYVRSGVL